MTQKSVRPAVAAKAPQPTHLSAVALHKSYRKGDHKVPVLRGVDLCVGRGEFLAVVGQSGCGKSTLMHLLGLLDTPDQGDVRLEGRRIDDLPAATRDELRNLVFGFVFQFYHLLPELTLLENVLAPLMIRHSAWEYWKQRKALTESAADILSKVGLDHRLQHRPSELSGGEMQRAAIARALVGKPRVLLADEPTGNLDSRTGGEIMDVLGRLNADEQLTIIMVTHDERLANQAQRIVRLNEGRIQTLEEAA
ncbi:MAG: ABC transporter ATP-binding protein [Planctomycetaceae bacterium]|nr:ABC transporter ATP-binding protein [Planctomycetaceae bacterium]